jgi:DNA-binding transcriptional LysR family regulator
MALAPFTFASFTALALASTAQLRNRHGLVELGDRAEHLAHQLGRGRVVDERAGIVGRDKVDASFAQLGVTDLLHHEIEVWALMTAPDFKGEVRLGVPHDIVGPYMPPVLKSFDQAWPGVRVSLVCSMTPKLLRALARREVDLTLTTECDGPLNGETLLQDPLVWVGARDGRAYKRDPLPVSIGDEDCAFRPVVIKALNHAGRDWRPVCEVSNMESLCATVEADLAVVPLLASTVPNLLEVLSFGAGLPPLPMFHINLHLPRMSASDIALELSRHIREQFAARYRRAA